MAGIVCPAAGGGNRVASAWAERPRVGPPPILPTHRLANLDDAATDDDIAAIRAAIDADRAAAQALDRLFGAYERTISR